MDSLTNTATVINQWAIPETPKSTAAAQVGYLPLGYTPARFDGALLAAGVELRYNLRSDRTQHRRVPAIGDAEQPTDWKDWSEAAATILRAELPTTPIHPCKRNDDALALFVTLDMPEKPFEAAVKLAAALNAVDPFLDYVQNETPRWDKVDRLDSWLFNCFDIADESYDLAGWAGEFILLGAVQRAMQPGCKLDETPVLIGPPGIGKSTALRELFPPALSDLFTDGLNLGSDAKTRVEALQGRAVVEIGEMAGARRADVESLKAFLSRTDDGSIRMAYKHYTEPMPRRCVVVGTADRADPLPPDHNLRRFVPITLEAGNVGRMIDYLDANRGQLWAEALVRYQQGKDARLPDWLKEQQRDATDNARFSDAIQDGVERYVASAPTMFTLEDAAYGVHLIEGPEEGAKISPIDGQRLGAALRQCGYQRKRKRIGGILKYVYIK